MFEFDDGVEFFEKATFFRLRREFAASSKVSGRYERLIYVTQVQVSRDALRRREVLSDPLVQAGIAVLWGTIARRSR